MSESKGNRKLPIIRKSLMSDQETSPDNTEKNKGFWNKAEQISRVYHNVMDGSFKLVIIVGVVAALVFGVGIYSKTTAGIDGATNWMCEYLNPFCDTPRETAAKAEEAQAEAARAAAVKAEEKASEIQAAPDPISSESTEEPGMFSRGWGTVKGWFSSDESPES